MDEQTETQKQLVKLIADDMGANEEKLKVYVGAIGIVDQEGQKGMMFYEFGNIDTDVIKEIKNLTEIKNACKDTGGLVTKLDLMVLGSIPEEPDDDWSPQLFLNTSPDLSEKQRKALFKRLLSQVGQESIINIPQELDPA